MESQHSSKDTRFSRMSQKHCLHCWHQKPSNAKRLGCLDRMPDYGEAHRALDAATWHDKVLHTDVHENDVLRLNSEWDRDRGSVVLDTGRSLAVGEAWWTFSFLFLPVYFKMNFDNTKRKQLLKCLWLWDARNRIQAQSEITQRINLLTISTPVSPPLFLACIVSTWIKTNRPISSWTKEANISVHTIQTQKPILQENRNDKKNNLFLKYLGKTKYPEYKDGDIFSIRILLDKI